MVSLDAVEQAVTEGDQQKLLLPVDSGLLNWPIVVLDQEESKRFQHGNPAPATSSAESNVRVYGPENQLLGLGEIRADQMVYPKRVFVW
jgi:tRNA pseudouridine55 synthase